MLERKDTECILYILFVQDCDSAEEHFAKLISTLLKLLQVPHLPWMSPSVTQKDSVCNTPKTPTTSSMLMTPIVETAVGGNTVNTLRNRNSEVNPRNISKDATTPRNVEETPRNTEQIPGSTSTKEVTPRNTACKGVPSTPKNSHLVTKRKRPQPSYHKLNVKRTKVTVNSKIKKKT